MKVDISFEITIGEIFAAIRESIAEALPSPAAASPPAPRATAAPAPKRHVLPSRKGKAGVGTGIADFVRDALGEGPLGQDEIVAAASGRYSGGQVNSALHALKRSGALVRGEHGVWALRHQPEEPAESAAEVP